MKIMTYKKTLKSFFFFTSLALASQGSCPSELIDVYLSKPLTTSMIHQSTHQFELNIPQSIFKGIGHVRPKILSTITVEKKTSDYQIKLQSPAAITASVKNSDKGAQLIIQDKSCVAKKSQKVIVIDAGHGGKDPGTIGVNQIKEKDVTLSVAKALAASLSKHPQLQVYLTRSQDEFITLRGRIALAQKREPDLFISIHADSAPRKTAQGMSVYALSASGASSEQAKYLADNNNNEATSSNQAIDGMIFQLTQHASIVSSLQLGSNIIASAGNVPVHINHVEQAAFVVLKAFDIPSVLIEIGFLSSPVDVKRLSSKKGQQEIVTMIKSGIFKYFGITHIDYVIKDGDTLSAIARRFNQPIADILKLNVGLKPHSLKPGAVIKIGGHSE